MEISWRDQEPSVPLSEVSLDTPHRVAAVNAGPELRQKLISMGLQRGVALRVVIRGHDQSHLVAIDNVRLGLDGTMSRAIQVHSQLPGGGDQEHRVESSLRATDQHQERLQNLPAGSIGRIEGYRQGSRVYRQKLLAMGLTPGTEFSVTRHAPMGDPVELKVRGFSLMLRKQEADMLIITLAQYD
ncbi:MAG: FeoA family protein [Cyanobacteria bacterium J06638_7]